ncbi:MAG: 50S ribosomal protein L18 [Chlamydiae bacterium]|nr:50S ribosomal protein L18 [Chlamydiota bacterium]MBI3277748.1 50S ribosomal protein L18 [Chlamydiota bacterium]
MIVKNVREIYRRNRHIRIRRKVMGTPERPRLAVFRSGKHMYAQLINDLEGRTLLSFSTLSKVVKEKVKSGANVKAAELLGGILAEEAKRKEITKIVFDRGGYLYHGRVKALAEAARKGGLVF